MQIAKNSLFIESSFFLFMCGLCLILTGSLSAEEPCSCHPRHPEQHATFSLQELIAEPLQTGTLLFHRGDCLAVKVYTRSPYTHVGVIVDSPAGWQIFDSANGVGTRQMLLTDYLADCAADEIIFYHPQQKLSETQASGLTNCLIDHLNRPYAISQFVSGEAADGIHCSEYATTALMAAGVLAAEKPCRVSPASLMDGITQAKIYSAGSCLQAVRSELTLPADAGYCTRLWLQTKDCTSRCCRKLSRMFFCRG